MTARSAVLRAVLLCAAAVLVWLQQETIPCGGFSARLFRSNAALSRRTSCRAAGARQPSAVRGLGSQVRAVSVRRTIVAHQRRARTPGRPPLGFRPASCMRTSASHAAYPPALHERVWHAAGSAQLRLASRRVCRAGSRSECVMLVRTCVLEQGTGELTLRSLCVLAEPNLVDMSAPASDEKSPPPHHAEDSHTEETASTSSQAVRTLPSLSSASARSSSAAAAGTVTEASPSQRQHTLTEEEAHKLIEDHLPAAFMCSLTSQLMIKPCVGPDERSYEEAAIRRWLSQTNKSPHTRQHMRLDQLIFNRTLNDAIQEWFEKPPAAVSAAVPFFQSYLDQNKTRGRLALSRQLQREREVSGESRTIASVDLVADPDDNEFRPPIQLLDDSDDADDGSVNSSPSSTGSWLQGRQRVGPKFHLKLPSLRGGRLPDFVVNLRIPLHRVQTDPNLATSLHK